MSAKKAIQASLVLISVPTVFYPLSKSKTEISCQDTPLNNKFREFARESAIKEYFPTPFLVRPFSQIVWLRFFCKNQHLDPGYKRELVLTKDGGTLSIDWLIPSSDSAQFSGSQLQKVEVSKAVVVVFPGLTGGSDKGYIKLLGKYLQEEGGFTVACFNPRGVGKTELTSPHLIDITSNEDVLRVFEKVREKVGEEAKLFAVGTSMGGNIAVKVQAQEQGRLGLSGICTFNAPFDLVNSVLLMRGKGYEGFFCKELRKHFIKQTEREQEHIDQLLARIGADKQKVLGIKSWDDYNRHYTAKAFPRFENPLDMYREASAMLYLDRVSVPTLVVHSKDDPIIKTSCMVKQQCLKNPHFLIAEVQSGSHVCYFEGNKGESRWYPKVAHEFFDFLLRHQQ